MARQIYETDAEWDDGGTPSWRARNRPTKRPIKLPSIGVMFLIGYIGPFVLLFLGAVVIVGYYLVRDALT
ncbi:hypothetical protein NFI95_15565 [Acetobacteraceae bacterium KSS8]|uniref:Uncharacterized protein n=1 Tax=Endosaccharibacter trunci TaxID=2812733 RepID=A0ABT1WAG0_9PROT|nr:hypothetical protein [Acetobacteraceae bacterium KSS8]